MNDSYVQVATVDEVPVDEMRTFQVSGERIALCNVGGTIYAIEDRCTHDDSPFGRRFLHGEAIECPRHGARFDVTTGAVLRMPAVSPLRTHRIRVENGVIYVAIGTK